MRAFGTEKITKCLRQELTFCHKETLLAQKPDSFSIVGIEAKKEIVADIEVSDPISGRDTRSLSFPI